MKGTLIAYYVHMGDDQQIILKVAYLEGNTPTSGYKVEIIDGSLVVTTANYPITDEELGYYADKSRFLKTIKTITVSNSDSNGLSEEVRMELVEILKV